MSACKLLLCHSLSFLEFRTDSIKICNPSSPFFLRHNLLSCSPALGVKVNPYRPHSRSYWSIQAAISIGGSTDKAVCPEEEEEEEEEEIKSMGDLLRGNDEVSSFMKMERNTEWESGRWFPYLDKFKAGTTFLSSQEVLEAVEPWIVEGRKERFRHVVNNRSYSLCLVVECLSDFGNVSAVFRSADALGFQSVHVVSFDSSIRYKEHRSVSMGAEKWLDIELWDSTQECFEVLRSRGYRIVTTHVGMEMVSIYDMDWSYPTAIVVGNESSGISEEALKMSDLLCSIPMRGMVDSFNVSVASAILMHHAVCDRNSRLGGHGDLTSEERQILLAEFSLRQSKSAVSIAHEHAKRKIGMAVSEL